MLRSSLALLALVAVSQAGQAQVKATAADLSRLSWMSGCWKAEAGDRVTEEQRMPLRAGTLVGVGRESRGGTLLSAELTIVRLRGDLLVFEAFPTGQPPAVFTASALTDSSVTFANPAHDFPQRVIYRKAGADSLIARIEGDRGGQARGVDFPMARAGCGQ